MHNKFLLLNQFVNFYKQLNTPNLIQCKKLPTMAATLTVFSIRKSELESATAHRQEAIHANYFIYINKLKLFVAAFCSFRGGVKNPDSYA